MHKEEEIVRRLKFAQDRRLKLHPVRRIQKAGEYLASPDSDAFCPFSAAKKQDGALDLCGANRCQRSEIEQ